MKKAFDILLLSGLVLLPLIQLYVSLLTISWVLGGIILMSLFLRPDTANIQITLGDILVFTWFLWLLISVIVISGGKVDSDNLLIWCIIGLTYLLFRIHKTQIIPLAVLLGGVIQVVIVLFQINGSVPSNHLYHQFTGSFTNPGPLGGYLALSAICALGLCLSYYKSGKTRKAIFAAIAFCIVSACILLSDSRAAIVSTMVGITFVLIQNFKVHIKSSIARLSLYGLLCVIPLLVVTLSYGRKQDSADGRLFIWRNSIDLLAERPYTGSGLGTFSEKYMTFQEEYFAKYPDSPYQLIAGNITDPFNEWIRIFCEFGIIGSVLLTLILITAFKKARNDNSVLYQAALISLVLFSMFSYPLRIIGISMLFGVMLAFIPYRTLLYIRTPRYDRYYSIVIVSALVTIINIYASSDTLKYYNHDFLRKYLKQQIPVTPKNQLEVIHRLAERVPMIEVFTELGDSYLRNNDTMNAITCYKRAYYMSPNRVMARYRLFKIYEQRLVLDSAMHYAISIIDNPPKISNTISIKIKKEAVLFLKTQYYDPKIK